MRAAFILLILSLFAPLGAQAQEEHVILCGGPALRKWENLRVESDRHDRWWANFIRASTLRMAEVRIAYGKQAKHVWIVYRNGYTSRAREDGKPYTTWIQEQATKRNCTLIWVNSGPQAIAAINRRSTGAIKTFDYFGHSNKYCFMLDYGSDIMAVSQAWIHEKDLSKINRRVFSPTAICQSWGCHTGESMSQHWRAAIGNSLIGAMGKTDYIPVGRGKMPTVAGRWTR